MIFWIQLPISKTVKPWVVWFWFTIIFNSWKSSHTFKWSWGTTIEIIFEMDLWYLGNVMLGPKFNSAIVAPNLQSNDTFCWGDKFCGRPVWFIDKIWRFGNQWPVSNTSPPTHQKLIFSSYFLMMKYNFSPNFPVQLSQVQSHIDKVTVGYSSDVAEVTFETSQLLRCHYQSLNILNATCQYPSSSSSKLCRWLSAKHSNQSLDYFQLR